MAKSSAKQETLMRAKRFYLVSILLVVALVVRIVWIQYFASETEYNAERLYDRIVSWQDIPAHRGSILDADGEPLAVSIYRYQVDMDYGSEGFDSLATFHRQSDSLARLLSSYFKDKSAAEYSKIMRANRTKHYELRYRGDSTVRRSEGWWYRLLDRLQDREFMTIKLYDTIRNHRPVALLPRTVDYTEWQTLKRWPIFNYNMGLTYNLSRVDSRVYPHSELARNTIGKTFEDSSHDYGIEAVCASDLAAQNGRVLRQRIARGFYGRVVEGDNVDPVDGCDVVTTLNVDIQDVVSRSLEAQLKEFNAIWGTSMVMEVATGKIVAMANLGRVGEGLYAEDYNYALKSRLEPGSTLKVASVLALLEEAGMSPDKIYDSGDGKLLMVGSARAQDAHKGYSEVDLRTATVQSLNGYFALAVHDHFNDSPKRFTDFLRSLHLDRTVGLEEFGAVKPSFRDPESSNWTHNNTIAYLGYGYGIELTPLHILTLYNAIANDGCMVAPRLIDRVERDGDVISRTQRDVLNPKICSQKSLNTLRGYLEEVATEGTAKSYMSGFKEFGVGAKTGTAKVSQGSIKYGDGYYLGSMASYMPADKPKYTILTSIYTRVGNGRSIYGGTLTGKAQQKIVQYLYNREAEWYDGVDISPIKCYPTAIKGGNVKQIREVTYQLSPSSARLAGDSEWGRVVTDSLANVWVEDIDFSTTTMPNVVGMGLKDALFMLESRGLQVSFTGRGRVREQSIKAGDKISAGARVSLRLN